MAVYFTDTSALSKRYVIETGTAWLRTLLDPSAGNTIYIVRVTTVELIAALTRRERGGTLASADANAARREFRVDLAVEYKVIEVTEALADQAMVLAETKGLRGYDAVQLAAALEVNASYLSAGMTPITLVSADRELNAAALAEGLSVEDPNAHP